MNKSNQNMKKPYGLIKKIERELEIIRNAYSKALKAGEISGVGEWLCDNYYILEREGRAIVKELKRTGKLPANKKGIPLIYNFCWDLCCNGLLPTQTELEEYMGKHPYSVRELELLPLFLRAVFIGNAAMGCEVEEKDGIRRLSNAIKSLINIQDIDFDDVFERVSRVEKILSLDPSGIYARMDEKTRSYYRRLVAKIAGKKSISEEQAANDAIYLAEKGETISERHVGTYLEHGKSKVKRGTIFLVLEAVIPAVIAILIGVLTKKWYLPLLLYFPLWELLRPLIEACSIRKVEPVFLPKMDLDGVVPETAPALVTVSLLLPPAAKSAELKRRLEKLKRTNSQGAITFCILADLKSAKCPTRPEDEADIRSARQVIKELNRKYGGGFIIAIRPRMYSATQEEYTGWERKRGAITQLIRAIKGESPEFICIEGDISKFYRTKYLVALDADTDLPMDTVSEMVATAIHPLNAPVVDPQRGRITKGYAVLVPRVEVDLESASKTNFSQIMAGDGGITVYDNSVADRYQDLFSESIFSGKGILDVNAFYTLLNDIFPEERVLSHDILEGGFLRAGFLSDIQVTDGFPSREGAYLDRLHRWVRGDWQNISWVSPNPCTAKGKIKNPLNCLSRYKLFDNLRRSFTPVNAMLAILLTIFMPKVPAIISVIVAILAVTCGHLFAAFRSVLAGGPSMFSRLYYSGTMPVALASITRAAVSLVMLAQTAFVCADAIIRALWRMFVSKKNLLEWVTAADSDKGQKLSASIKRYLPSVIIGLLLVVFGRDLAVLCGIIFIFNLPFAVLSSKIKPQKGRSFNYLARETMTSYAAAMWKYYEEFCTPGDNYLPPDNVQETPVHRIAHRTSPTNIGMMLLCTLAARDLGFIDSNMLAFRLNATITATERLEKWNGNLLNWHNTKTLKPLEPRYVSTVDSGNFICCLIALRKGLEEYVGECSLLTGLIDRITALIEECDLSVLYNKRRKLFHIGYDLNKNEASNSYYDLLMSEARMTSYYAIASRVVPKKHWGAMGRTLARAGRYTGPVSWTGTMFEYYMPHILLPVYENSLGFESLRFCSWCQKRRVKGKNIPWGISESGFYAFDPHLNYQYKAHGVQKLGLKRGLNSDLVISPYSTFLVLPFDTDSALRNLKELEKLEMIGRCGFYEAADFTKKRVEGQDYAVVRSYMAHHIGMSLLSVCNTLKNDIMQKRFMSDELMSSATSLLEEKIPSGAVVFKDVELREVPQRAERVTPQTREFDNITPTSPHMRLLTNGEWSTAVCDNGASVSLYRGVNITRRSNDLLQRPMGVFAAIKANDKTIPLMRSADYQSESRFSAYFSHTDVTLKAKKAGIEGSMMTIVHQRLPCEERVFTIKNNRKTTLDCNLVIYFEPSLSDFRSEQEHPAFSRLFIECNYDASNKVLIYTKRVRGNDKPLSIAVGFLEKVPFTFETSRDKMLTSPFGITSFLEKEVPLQNGIGVADLCAAFSIPLKIPSRLQTTATLAICAATTKDEAISALLKAREEGTPTASKGAPSPFVDDGLDGVIAGTILPQLFYSIKETKENIDATKANQLSANAVWAFGISSDNPIIYIEIHNPDDLQRALPYIRLNKKLRRSGIITDIAIAFREGGEYSTPILSAIRQVLRREGCEENLNQDGGIHACDLTLHFEEARIALMAAATYIAPISGERIGIPAISFKPMVILPALPKKGSDEIQENHFTQDSYVINKKPNTVWGHVLANSQFGTLVSAGALGYTWAMNSRENKITPWYNDTRTDNRGEMLLLRIHDTVYDLLLGARAELFADKVCYYSSIENLDIKVTVWVPSKGMVKYCEVEITGNADEEVTMELVYYIEPVLGVNRSTARFIKSSFDGSGVKFTSPWNTAVQGTAMLKIQNGASFFCCDREKFLKGKWQDDRDLPLPNSCIAVGKQISLPPKRRENIRFILSWAAEENAAQILTRLKFDQEESNKLIVKTPDENINHMVNVWLPVQIKNSRIKGRTGFYQCGGAWGFRDQLQDICSIILTNPKMAYRHILRCAAVQFEEGDVLHWWHRLPKKGGGIHGVRTHYSDDLLWLPYAVAEYVQKTGDWSILNFEVHYLTGEELSEEEVERYFEPARSEKKGTIYEHCIKSIQRASRFGEHGLPLIGGGDWNDGFNEVGIKGRGESVWLAQFLAIVMERMVPLCSYMGDANTQEEYKLEAIRLKSAVDETAWNDDHYLRAFYDDGTPMGANGAEECAIDLLPQAFSVLSDMPDKNRIHKALDSAVRELVDEENGIIKLFAPPFGGKGHTVGYVSAYPKGIRENGGQYTHAAVWLCLALIENKQADEGYRLLKLINPAEKYEDEAMAQKYQTEPYALAGDVSSNPAIAGRGGWTLYSGAAGWYYKTVYESLLGIKQRNGTLYLEPNLPSDWHGFEAKLEIDGAVVEIEVKNAEETSLMVDGKPAEFIPLDGQNHKVIFTKGMEETAVM